MTGNHAWASEWLCLILSKKEFLEIKFTLKRFDIGDENETIKFITLHEKFPGVKKKSTGIKCNDQ